MLRSLWHVLPRRRAATAAEPRLQEAPPPVQEGRSSVVTLDQDRKPRVRGSGAIELHGITKTIGLRPRETLVLNGLDAIFPRGRAIGVLGAPGAGKTTLIQLLTGNLRPDAGRVIHGMSVSWPMSARDIFRKEMSIRANVRLLSTLYGAWAPDMIDAVKEIGKIRRQDLDMPIGELAPDFMIRASTSLCYALDFDCYITDDMLCLGARPFRDTIKELMLARQKTHSFIIASKSAPAIRDLCDDFYILEDGVIKTFGDRRATFKAFTGVALTARLDPRGEARDDEF
ncbi:ATP-binding cassette domain-containing protein [Xanthobacter agilis]|uniref:Capsular polysaccharide transport system ATP-binding protein n=1 Tax=Xanthobacter agilis TaxID=47492 RepID=A0ABU0LBE7_XANAG|nr:ATP-binding cassette domain-containing protein [Xanthobacter agilis]MDQ0504469.1 capsular polysaccharide transport system ATP-binding protein [Xanthobacter agilis]